LGASEGTTCPLPAPRPTTGAEASAEWPSSVGELQHHWARGLTSLARAWLGPGVNGLSRSPNRDTKPLFDWTPITAWRQGHTAIVELVSSTVHAVGAGRCESTAVRCRVSALPRGALAEPAFIVSSLDPGPALLSCCSSLPLTFPVSLWRRKKKSADPASQWTGEYPLPVEGGHGCA